MTIDLRALFSTSNMLYAVKRISSYLWEALLAFTLMLLIPLIFIFEGNTFITYMLLGSTFILFIGRRSFCSDHAIFSKPMLPCFLPGLLLCFFWIMPLFRSNWASLGGMITLIFLSRWVLFFEPTRPSSYKNMLKKVIFFISLQGLYGVGMQTFAPKYLNELTWTFYPEPLQYDSKKIYHSSTGIAFYYEDLAVAERIELSLPTVVSTLRTSPLFQHNERLTLIQKSPDGLAELMQASSDQNIGGIQNPLNHHSYYFTSSEVRFSCDPTYYSHNDPDRSVITHELTHQMLSQYYGKWTALLTIELWKNEGYAEYMAATGCYEDKSEFLMILSATDTSDEVLASPFASGRGGLSKNTFSDYVGALVQTRYALDVKKIPLVDFFKSSYKPASAQEIKDWLEPEGNGEEKIT